LGTTKIYFGNDACAGYWIDIFNDGKKKMRLSYIDKIEEKFNKIEDIMDAVKEKK